MSLSQYSIDEIFGELVRRKEDFKTFKRENMAFFDADGKPVFIATADIEKGQEKINISFECPQAATICGFVYDRVYRQISYPKTVRRGDIFDISIERL